MWCVCLWVGDPQLGKGRGSETNYRPVHASPHPSERPEVCYQTPGVKATEPKGKEGGGSDSFQGRGCSEGNSRTTPPPRCAQHKVWTASLAQSSLTYTLPHLIIPLTQELESLGSFVHEDPI